jgi:predicted small secreted protein
MKSFALVLMLIVASTTLGGCFVGKGKAPIATRG